MAKKITATKITKNDIKKVSNDIKYSRLNKTSKMDNLRKKKKIDVHKKFDLFNLWF